MRTVPAQDRQPQRGGLEKPRPKAWVSWRREDWQALNGRHRAKRGQAPLAVKGPDPISLQRRGSFLSRPYRAGKGMCAFGPRAIALGYSNLPFQGKLVVT